MLKRLKLLLKLWKYTKYPYYAVIYDSYEVKDDPREEYYEVFTSPEKAEMIFRIAFPAKDKLVERPRIVLILNPLDGYRDEL